MIFLCTLAGERRSIHNAIIDESVEEIYDNAFYSNPHLRTMAFNLQSVVCHDGVLKVGKRAFGYCRSLQRVKMPGAKIIEERAFYGCDCERMTHVELYKSETVGDFAFCTCTSLKRVKLPKVKSVGIGALCIQV